MAVLSAILMIFSVTGCLFILMAKELIRKNRNLERKLEESDEELQTVKSLLQDSIINSCMKDDISREEAAKILGMPLVDFNKVYDYTVKNKVIWT